MAELNFILQAVTTANHADAIRTLIDLRNIDNVLISVAFARESGVSCIEKEITTVANKTKFFVGIRNDVTSIQAIRKLLAMNVVIYAVDTGSRNIIFHPKIYFAGNSKQARIIIGSANLTSGGLFNNIEASTLIELEMDNPRDSLFVNEATSVFNNMIKDHPLHVFPIIDEDHASELLMSGRLSDESKLIEPSIEPFGNNTDIKGSLPPMNLTPPRFSHGTKKIKKESTDKIKPVSIVNSKPIPEKKINEALNYKLVWKSKNLTERDLCIPKHKGTNPTGSMGWKKGDFKNMDHRHYFREDVFLNVNWTLDSEYSIWERAYGVFELVINGNNIGTFNLKLSHNTDVDSKSYKQRNFMTQLHWGEAKGYIAKNNLLGTVLYLYRAGTKQPKFRIEIK